ILRQTFDCGTTHGRFIQVEGIAPNDHRYSLATCIQSIGFERRGHRFHMRLEALLCGQARTDKHQKDEAEWQGKKKSLDRETRGNTKQQDEDQGGNSPPSAVMGVITFLVPTGVKSGNQSAYPGDRV